jgi:hypothetical protein
MDKIDDKLIGFDDSFSNLPSSFSISYDVFQTL